MPRQTARSFYVAASLGFEPRQRDPESLVLPLHYEARSEKLKTDSLRCKSGALAPVNFRLGSLPRAGFRCLPERRRFRATFRSLLRVRERERSEEHTSDLQS